MHRASIVAGVEDAILVAIGQNRGGAYFLQGSTEPRACADEMQAIQLQGGGEG